MQERHKDHSVYFEEAATSCRRHYIPYIEQHSGIRLDASCRVLEVGCGIGGNLSVFAERGCSVTGIDINSKSIEKAVTLAKTGTFLCSDVFDYSDPQGFDLVMLHDTLEHIPEKERLLLHLKSLLKEGGILYLGFPAWQMPFGGHQQMSKSRFVSHCPWIHLLPVPLFRLVLRAFGEPDSTVNSFLGIRKTRITIEGFERLAVQTGMRTIDRRLYLVNPHYEVKFGLRPRILSPIIARIPYLRNFFTTTSYWLLSKQM